MLNKHYIVDPEPKIECHVEKGLKKLLNQIFSSMSKNYEVASLKNLIQVCP